MMRALFVAAGLCGALGIVLMAVAAHGASAARLTAPGTLMLAHGSAFLALALALHQGALARPWAGAVGAGWLLGLVLFCGDIALRVFAETRLFPNAAPAGGFVLIGSWLLLALAGLRRPR